MREVLPPDELIRQLRQVNQQQVEQINLRARAERAALRREAVALQRLKECEKRLDEIADAL